MQLFNFKQNKQGQAGTENTQPLPNPWGGSAQTNTANQPSSNAPAPGLANMNNIFSQLMGGLGGGAAANSSTTSTTNSSSTTTNTNTQRPANQGGLFNQGGVQDLMQQMRKFLKYLNKKDYVI